MRGRRRAAAGARAATRGGVPLGGALTVRRGTAIKLVIDIGLADTPNWAQFVPTLARVDVIRGDVTGPVADRDMFTTPATKVVKAFEVAPGTGQVSFTYPLGQVDTPFYVRIRGTDGKRSARRVPGRLGRPGRTRDGRRRQRGPVERPVVLRQPDLGPVQPVTTGR